MDAQRPLGVLRAQARLGDDLHLLYPSNCVLTANGASLFISRSRFGTGGGAGSVCWLQDVDNTQLRFLNDPAHGPSWEPNAETFREWNTIGDRVADYQQQLLRPWSECRAYCWPSLQSFLDNPLGGDLVEHLPMSDLDGGRLLRLDVYDGRRLLGYNEPFYCRDECATPNLEEEGGFLLVWLGRVQSVRPLVRVAATGPAPPALGCVCSASSACRASCSASADGGGPMAALRAPCGGRGRARATAGRHELV